MPNDPKAYIQPVPTPGSSSAIAPLAEFMHGFSVPRLSTWHQNTITAEQKWVQDHQNALSVLSTHTNQANSNPIAHILPIPFPAPATNPDPLQSPQTAHTTPFAQWFASIFERFNTGSFFYRFRGKS